MKLQSTESDDYFVLSKDGEQWFKLSDLHPSLAADIDPNSLTDLLSFYNQNPDKFRETFDETNAKAIDRTASTFTLPFEPLSYRDFMLFEEHAIEAKRGFVKKYMSHLLPMINIYERVANKTFPKLKPEKRWYEYPIYYLGNHLNFISDQSDVKLPPYTKELDYELELGVVLCEPLYNATEEQAESAMGGFVVFNDFSARDVQAAEMQTGFGPMKSKNFANSISHIVVTADEILPKIDTLKVDVRINDKTVMQSDTRNMYYSLAEAIAYASWEEHLFPGEFFATGTIPGCTGIENGEMLKIGDKIKLTIEGIGSVENTVV